MKVVIESFGTLKGKTIEGIALTPAVSLNRNIYSIESIDSARNLDIPLKADWEHTDEIVGTVVYSKGPNHSILYKAEITSERANEIKEGIHKVSIEAQVDEVVNSCNRKGCYNLVDGITFEGIGITTNPGVQTTTLNIIESHQEWPVIEGKHCIKCEEKESITVPGIYTINGNTSSIYQPFTTATGTYTLTPQINESEELKKKIDGLEKEIEVLKMPKCEHCGKIKKI